MNCSKCDKECCRMIPIGISFPELNYLLDIKPNLNYKVFGNKFYLTEPCDFQNNGKCSIYDVRPLFAICPFKRNLIIQ